MNEISLDNCIKVWGKSINQYLQYHENRNVIVYGEDTYTMAVAETVMAMGYNVECILSDTLFDTKIKILPVSYIKGYSYNQFFVLAAMLTNHKKAYETLIDNEYKLNEDFAIMGMGGYTKPIDAIDSLLGFTRKNDDIPGFKVWKGQTENAFKIVVLGNSTSDPTTGMLKSWSEMLIKKLQLKGYSVTLYNGAVTGYCSTQEFLKFNRDVLTLKPDLVISFSGYNDIDGTSSVEGFPYLHRYLRKFYEFLKDNPKLAPDSMYMRSVSLVSHGLPAGKPDYMIWIENMQKMFTICQLFSIKFVAYFQPMMEIEDAVLDPVIDNIINQYYGAIGESRELALKKAENYCKKVQKHINDYSFVKNLNGLFKGEKDVFYDICHYTEKGNFIISEKIYQDIKNLLLEKRTTHE